MSPLLWFAGVYGSVLAIPFIAITFWTFPYTGIALSLGLILTMIFLAQKQRQRYDTGLFMLGLTMCVLFVLRAHPVLTFLLLSGTVWIGSYLVVGATHPAQALFLPLRAFLTVITTKNTLITNIQKGKLKNRVTLTRLVIVIEIVLITVGTILFAVVLLSGTNPYFDTLIQSTGYTRLYELLQQMLNTENFFPLLVMRIVAWLFLFIVLPKTVSYLMSRKQKEVAEMNLPLFIPLCALATIIIIFFATQLTFYFAPREALMAIGYTSSRYARELFAQLIGLSALSVFLVWYTQRTRISNMVSALVLIEGLFLSGIAFRSVYSYHLIYGLTQKRIFGYAGMLWIVCVLLYVLYRRVRTQTNYTMMGAVFAISMCILAATAALNIDQLIYTLDKPRINGKVDYLYLARLSTDAYHYHTLLPQLMWMVDKKPNSENVHAAWIILRQAKSLVYTNTNNDWRNYNASLYHQYTAIKNMPLDNYEKKLTMLLGHFAWPTR